MGGGNSSSNNFGLFNTTSTYTPNPMAMSYYNQAMGTASNLALLPYTPYTGDRIAGFSPDQLAAMQGIRNMQGMTQPYTDAAQNYLTNAVNYANPANFSQAAVGQYFNPLTQNFINNTPMNYSQGTVEGYYNPLLNEVINNSPQTYSRENVDQYRDPTLNAYLQNAPLNYSAAAVQQYYNPYQQNVIDTTMAQIAQQNKQQQAQQNDQLMRSGAFGGDRTAGARAMLAGQQALSQQGTLANLQQQGYNQALNTFQQQQGQALGIAQNEAQRANQMFQNQQQLGFNARNLQQQQAVNQFNTQQAAALNAAQQGYAQALGQYNTQQQQAINANQQAAYGMSQLGSQEQQAEMQRLQALFGSGGMQQQLQQQGMNQAYEDFLAPQAHDAQALGYLLAAAGIGPATGGTTNTSGWSWGKSDTQQSGGAGSIIGSILGGIGGAGKMFGLASGGRVGKANGGSFWGPSDLGGTSGASAAGQVSFGDIKTGVPEAGFLEPSYSRGFEALYTPQEQRELAMKKWVSPEAKSEIEYTPYEYEPIEYEESAPRRHHRSERAAGGGMFKNPYEALLEGPMKSMNPGVAEVLSQPAPQLKPQPPQHLQKAPMPNDKGGGGGGGLPSGEQLGKGLGALSGISKKMKTIGTPDNKAVGAEGPEFPVGDQNATPLPPKRPEGLGGASEGAGGGFLDSIKSGIGGLLPEFANGGRVPKADGGARGGFDQAFATDANGLTVVPSPTVGQTELAPIPYTNWTNFGRATGSGMPVGFANTGSSVYQTFGPYGFGRPYGQDLASWRTPYNSPTGSTGYNRMALDAMMNVGRRQLTPEEWGFRPMETQTSRQQLRDALPSLVQIAGAAGQEKADLQAKRDAMLKQYRQPVGYQKKFTYNLTPEGRYEEIPISEYYSAMFADGGRVGRKDGGRRGNGFWGRLANVPEGVREAALALKEDFNHPLEVMHSIANRVRSGAFPGGSDPDAIMAARSQYEPLSRRNRGTERDPRTVNPNDPRVRELAEQWPKIRAGEIPDPVNGATNFGNMNIIKQRYGHLRPYEAAAVNDPNSVKVGQQLFYTPKGVAAGDRPGIPLPPHRPAGLGDDGAPMAPFSKADVSGGALNMPKGFEDVYPVEKPAFGRLMASDDAFSPDSKRIGMLADLSPAPTGANALGITHDFENDQPLFGFENRGHPAVASGYKEPREGGAGFADLAPQPYSGFKSDTENLPKMGPPGPFEGPKPMAGAQPFQPPAHREITEPPPAMPEIGPEGGPPPGLAPVGGDQPAEAPAPEAPAPEAPSPGVAPPAARPAPAHHGVRNRGLIHHAAPAPAQDQSIGGLLDNIFGEDSSHPSSGLGFLEDLFGGGGQPQSGGGFDIGSVFGGDAGGGGGGFDIGKGLTDILGGGFARGGMVGGRHGYKGGGRPSAKELYDYFVNEEGASPSEALVLTPAAGAESAYDPTAVHDSGIGYGLFGHNKERLAAMRKMAGADEPDWKQQAHFGLDEFRHRPEHRMVEGESPSIEDIIGAHMAFEAPKGYKPGHPELGLGYGKRLALTKAMMNGDFNSAPGGGGGGDHVVATDRGDEGGGMLANSVFNNKDKRSEMWDFLLATGLGTMASRNPSALGALGEGGMRGLEAMNASRSSRVEAMMKELQAQNLASEISKRNIETSEAVRQLNARRAIAGGKPGQQPPAPAPTGKKAVSEIVPEVIPGGPKVASNAPAPSSAPAQGPAPASKAAPKGDNVVAEEPVPDVPNRINMTANVPEAYDTGKIQQQITQAEHEEEVANWRAEQARAAGLLSDAKDYEAQAKGAQDRKLKLMEDVRKVAKEPFPIAGEDLKKDYESTQAAGRAAQDRIGNLTRLRKMAEQPGVYQGLLGEQVLEAKKGVRAAEDLIPSVKGVTEKLGLSPDRKGIAASDAFVAEANRSMKDEIGSLGGGTSNRDVDIVAKTGPTLGTSPEGNQLILDQKIRIAQRQQEIAEFQRRYIAKHGGLDANYNTALNMWAESNPMFEDDGKPTPPTLLPGKKESKGESKGERKIVRTGMRGNQKVVQYSDGTIENAE